MSYSSQQPSSTSQTSGFQPTISEEYGRDPSGVTTNVGYYSQTNLPDGGSVVIMRNHEDGGTQPWLVSIIRGQQIAAGTSQWKNQQQPQTVKLSNLSYLKSAIGAKGSHLLMKEEERAPTCQLVDQIEPNGRLKN